jgi:HD-GYP domain-containing protein (c-di-GMP phosphodiesterase class II)
MAAAAVLPAGFLETVGDQPAAVAPLMHFVMVACTSAIAALAAAGLSVAGIRRHDGRTVLLSAAFSTMTALLLVHGLATPGVLIGMNGVVAFAGALSLPSGAVILGLTALPGLRRPRLVHRMVALQVALALAVVALGIVGMAFPSLVPSVPSPGSAPAVALTAVGGALYLMLALRALRTFALTHRPTDLVVAVGCVWLGVALFPQLIIGFGTVGFYLGHGFEIFGLAMVALPAVLDLRRGGASRPLVGDLSAAEIVVAEESFLGPRVRALLVSLENKDRSTERHTRRVALLAVRVGEQLRLPPASLRHLAVGALLHDIGKLAVADAVLGKPGALTDAEFEEIKRHPGAGLRLLADLGGFDPEVHRLVGSHHERLDGSGYPEGLRDAEIGIGPRILAICDVFDALTSDRVYRGAWTEAEALDLLRGEAGTKLDAACVHALEQVLSVVPARRAVHV